jgi:hypothetical protein
MSQMYVLPVSSCVRLPFESYASEFEPMAVSSCALPWERLCGVPFSANVVQLPASESHNQTWRW